jgi:hypothetical protein
MAAKARISAAASNKKAALFEKSAQKLLLIKGTGADPTEAQVNKSFLLLFFKREALSLALLSIFCS